MFAPENEQFIGGEDFAEEMVARAQAGGEIGGGVRLGVHGAAEAGLGGAQEGDQIGAIDFADDEQIDVAVGAFLSAGDGAEDEGEADARGEGGQQRAENIHQAGGFSE